MDKNVTKFDDTEIEKYKFHLPYFDRQLMLIKQYYLIRSLQVKRILNILMVVQIFKKYTFMHIPSKNEHIQKTKCISFMIKDEKFLKKYNKIWKKVSNIIKKEFDSKPVCNEKV